MSNIFIDIESIPSASPPAICDIPDHGSIKDTEKQYAWKVKKQDELWRAESRHPLMLRILCCCWAVDDGPILTAYSRDADEQKIITQLADQFGPRASHLDFSFVGWNALGFDMPAIRMRAVKYGAKNLARVIDLDRYRGNVIDLMLDMCGHISNSKGYSQENACKFFDVHVRREDDLTGADVFDSWQRGEHDRIKRHCQNDVDELRQLYYKIRG